VVVRRWAVLGAGAFGENLTVSGVELNDALIASVAGGRRGAESRRRLPAQLGLRMGDAEFSERFGQRSGSARTCAS
jgi:hypothetical protein